MAPYLSMNVDPCSMRMREPLLWISAVLLSVPAAAQVPVSEPSPAQLQQCLLRTPADTWATLKLTSDQLRRMGFVQEACREECEATGAKKEERSISNADGSTVLSEVKNILSEDQYAAWVATCGSKP